MWSGTHDDDLEQTVRALAGEIARRRSVQRARAAARAREWVAQSRRTARATEDTELQRRAVLGQIPAAEYKARTVARAAGVEVGRNPFAR
ncbi:hypothetical protein SAZ_40045 [Streptomyces noursei ZPM]|uniref:Uncharacterized protein n=1 Tax=Streptomyces noursei TaxID=1971 RepID=A0A401QQY6_STRNR|nr:hypothetical protein [Streptomyces noursei]AKA09190.1 hypothetical protein SAZ_40045 [Streptomyces noursei ZPM]EOS99438.1 hypothetical protein K530_33926 [Streptomyces noursei CCRC 11814]EXU91141.1 hypothetical protein P354_09140 [Streptomyces noursei PD-1]UWS76482.1 hypothetical protein N1H47_37710 [Streptomyces noursei]GCB87806.1 hypothetical protein SALB_00475 [Streptomyces noursei]